MQVKDFILLLLIVIAGYCLMVLNQSEDYNTESEYLNTIDSLAYENESLLIDIENLDACIKERDSLIMELGNKLSANLVTINRLKKTKNEKINSINSITPDSLYNQLSGIKTR